MFFQRGSRVGHGHCGLTIYIHETFLSQEVIIENVNTSSDYLCVQLSHSSPNSKKYLLCNVYNNNNNNNIFISYMLHVFVNSTL